MPRSVDTSETNTHCCGEAESHTTPFPSCRYSRPLQKNYEKLRNEPKLVLLGLNARFAESRRASPLTTHVLARLRGQDAGDAGAGFAVAVGVHGLLQAGVLFRAVQEANGLRHDPFRIRPDQPAVPASRPSTRSVTSRRTSTGLPSEGASS